MVYDSNRQDAKDAKKKILSLKHPLGELGVLGGYISFSFLNIVIRKSVDFNFSDALYKLN